MKADKEKISFVIAIILLVSNAPFAQQKSEIKIDQYRAINWTISDGAAVRN